MTHVIYKITSPSGKVYIGRTKHFSQRMADHKFDATSGRKNQALHKAIRKYGWDNMTKEIIDQTSESKIVALEYYYIGKYNSIKEGYNNTINTSDGGNVWNGKEDTQQFKDFKDKMKIINSGKNNGMYGRKHSEETKKLLKEKAAGRCSLEWFIDKHGEVEGTRRYESMMEKRRKNRYAKMKTDSAGRFTK
jgi:group I intron endonuclease